MMGPGDGTAGCGGGMIGPGDGTAGWGGGMMGPGDGTAGCWGMIGPGDDTAGLEGGMIRPGNVTAGLVVGLELTELGENLELDLIKGSFFSCFGAGKTKGVKETFSLTSILFDEISASFC